MIEGLVNIITLLGTLGYLIVFLAAFLESSAFLGFLVPGESIVVIAGVLASQGYLELGDCITVISLGAVLGDTVGYSLGRTFGRDYFERHGRFLFIKAKHLDRADNYFHKHGGKTIFFGRFIGFFRAMAPFAAGISKMPYGRFLIFNVTGGVLWATSFTLLGYFFAVSWKATEQWVGRAGVFVFFLLLVFIGLTYLYKVLLKRQDAIYSWCRDKYSHVVSSPGIKAFTRNHPSLVVFLTERLSPKKYLGLHLTAGLFLSSIFIIILGKIIEDILTGDPLVLVDRWVIVHILYFRTPSVTEALTVFTQLGGAVTIMSGSIMISVYFFIKKRFECLIALLAAVLGGNILVFMLKIFVNRPRPESPLIKLTGVSFPSGHVMMSVIFYGMILYFLIRNRKSWKLQVFIMLAAVFTVFFIGFTRIYFQVNYLSDILAGYAGGLFWLTVCITGLEIYKKRVGRKTMVA